MGMCFPSSMVYSRMILTGSFRTNSPLVSSTCWTLLEVLRAPALAEQLSAATARHCPPSSSTYSIPDLVKIPLLASLHTEVKRLRTSTAAVRKNDSSETKLDSHWTLPRGTPALYFSHDISLDTDRWAKARPRAVDKPLEEFWAERFLVPDGKASRSKRLNGTTSGSFSVEGLETLTAVFDDGASTCAGSEFAMAMQTATLAVVLNEFEVQLCEPERAKAVIPPVRERSYGAVKPLDKIEVRVRKRNV
jgi:cytochrome P450